MDIHQPCIARNLPGGMRRGGSTKGGGGSTKGGWEGKEVGKEGDKEGKGRREMRSCEGKEMGGVYNQTVTSPAPLKTFPVVCTCA